MKNRSVWIPLLVLAGLAAVALAVYLSTSRFDTTLEFSVRDAVSQKWVWNTTITLQDRVIRGFYQSDQGPIVYRFTRLRPGPAELQFSAPSYEPVTVPVTLKRGRNVLQEPVQMRGLEIPDLDHFILFEELEGSDVVVEIRPVGKTGEAVTNHPCLELWIGARVSVQMKDGVYVQQETEEGSVRGQELFRGRIDWSFDSQPETVFRYSARIPGSRIAAHKAPLRVIDYLIVVPLPRQGRVAPGFTEEMDRLLQDVWNFRSERELTAFLDREGKDRFRYFIVTDWNVKGAAQ